MIIKQTVRPPGAFQQPVDEADLSTQLSCELAGETILAVRELESGLFNNTFRVDTASRAYILKVAPAEDREIFFSERSLMRRERAVARHLEAAGPLVPRYLAFFAVGGREASLQPLVAGRLWSDEIDCLSAAENAELWRQLGMFAKRLHGCRGERFGYPEPCAGFSRWSEFIVSTVEGLAEDCRRLGVYGEEIETYRTVLPRFRESLDQVRTPRLLHGDLWPRNVIIDGAGADIHLAAVFDGERAFWGDPASDWVLILYGVPPAFWDGYGERLLETADPVRIAVYRGMYFILNILEAVRCGTSDEAPRGWLSSTNAELERA